MLNQQPFMDFVAEEAKKIGKIFILDSGEGNDFIDAETGWYVEDLSGWLVNENSKDQLLESKESGNAYEEFSDSYVFAKWLKTNDKLEIVFRKF